MKKITISFLTALITYTSLSQINYRDITDVTFTHDSWTAIDIDFNNDGTAEFTLDEQGGGTVGTFFDPTLVNFYGTGDFNSGHGWDIMKALNYDESIDNNGIFDAFGDAYINAFWANANELFPEGDSYIGVWFKLGVNKHYGWLRVNSASGIITLLDYAYNETPDAAIKAGQTVLSVQDFNNGLKVALYPNPTTDYINIEGTVNIEAVNLINLLGQSNPVKVINHKIDISKCVKGVYFLHLTTIDNKTATKKIIIR